jgi:TatD DNase family protein
VIDTHAHLESCEGTVPELIAAARAAGVDRVITIGCGEESSRWAVATAEAHPEVFATIGVHPNQADEYQPTDVVWIRELGGHPKVVGVGECGLDYFRDRATPLQQMRAFDAQIEIAVDLGMPLCIHSREATDDTIARLADVSTPVLIHCFSMPERAHEVVARGWYAAFGGAMTYPKNADLRAAVAALPADRLLIETDAPYLAPQGLRGKPNQPAYVATTLQFLAEALGIDVAQADALTTANAERLFGL